MTAGELLVVMGYIAAIYKPLEQISNTVSALQEQFISLRIALRPARHRARRSRERPDAGRRSAARRAASPSRTCHFTYPGRSGTLADVSLRRRARIAGRDRRPDRRGQDDARLSLIPRFYDPQRGRDPARRPSTCATCTLASLRAQISIVLQEPLLFSGTIADNIRYGRLEADDDEGSSPRPGRQRARLHRRGCRTATRPMLGERGARLSGGERQRICDRPRVPASDAPILILDEPTSSIDSRTEAVILDALDRLRDGRTTFTIAHRLSTISGADRILVMDQGRLVEPGTHDELLEHDGLYRQLWDVQTGGRAASRESAWSRPRRDATTASNALVTAVRLLVAAGPTDLAALAVNQSEADQIREAAAILAALTPSRSTRFAISTRWISPRWSARHRARSTRGGGLVTGPPVVLLGMLTKIPVAGPAWLVIHYMEAFRRLGYDPWYVEAHSRTPRRSCASPGDDGVGARCRVRRRASSAASASAIAGRSTPSTTTGACTASRDARLRRLYRSAELVINLHGGTRPTAEHSRAARSSTSRPTRSSSRWSSHDGRPRRGTS